MIDKSTTYLLAYQYLSFKTYEFVVKISKLIVCYLFEESRIILTKKKMKELNINSLKHFTT